MRSSYYVFTFMIGICLAIQLTMNGAAGMRTGNFRMANALFWTIGAVTAILIGLSGYEPGFWSRVRQVPVYLWAGGAMGGVLLYVIAILITRMGAASFSAVVLTGQIFGGLLIAHYGLMQTPVERLTIVRLTGAVVMAVGAYMAVLGRLPWFH